MYQKSEKLEITNRIGVTEEVYKKLRSLKRETGISMQKIICMLVNECGDVIKSLIK